MITTKRDLCTFTLTTMIIKNFQRIQNIILPITLWFSYISISLTAFNLNTKWLGIPFLNSKKFFCNYWQTCTVYQLFLTKISNTKQINIGFKESYLAFKAVQKGNTALLQHLRRNWKGARAMLPPNGSLGRCQLKMQQTFCKPLVIINNAPLFVALPFLWDSTWDVNCHGVVIVYCSPW